jgi:hypothetical protein
MKHNKLAALNGRFGARGAGDNAVKKKHGK